MRVVLAATLAVAVAALGGAAAILAANRGPLAEARAAWRPARRAGAEGTAAPRYAADGALLRPDGFDAWVLAGASLGLGYSRRPSRGEGPGHFHNVYVPRDAYDHYARTGAFPDKTMLVMAVYEAAERTPPSTQGFFEGELLGVEVAVKDRERFAEGWAYFDFGPGGQAPRARALPPAACHQCHAAHAAVDNVFVQFYPVLRRARLAQGAGGRGGAP